MIQFSEREERLLWTAGGTALLMLLAGPAVRSPDGMEMLRLTASWLGIASDVGDPSFWPPLWSGLNLPAVALGHDTAGARLLNLLCWGALIWPLHLLADRLGGRRSARIAVLLFMLTPAVFDHATVLDARPLGALITTAFVAASINALAVSRGLLWAVALAAVAPFARPEGVLLPVLAGAVIWRFHGSWWKGLVGAGVALLPHALFRSSVRGLSGHEQLFAPWYGTWSTWDLLSLFGPASVPTEFRRFALAAVEAGVVQPEPAIEDLVAVIAMMPGGLVGAATIVAGAVGLTGVLAVLRGGWAMGSSSLRSPMVVLVGLPFVAVAVAPMAKDQAGPLSNYLFVLPSILAMAAVGINSLKFRWGVGLAVAAVLMETQFTPLRHAQPYFLEGSEAAALAAEMLANNPPAGGVVGADFSSRDVVLRAGFEVEPVGPIWLGKVPPDLDAVLINSVGAKGEDGGRTLRLLESPKWRVVWVVGDGDLALSQGQRPVMPRSERGWYALLERR